MKTLTALMLFISIASDAQFSFDAGIMSRMQATFSLAVEKQTGWNNTAINVRASTDNAFYPIASLQTGCSTRNPFQQNNYRFMIGGFYHTGIIPVNKETRERQLRLGGSIRFELNNGTVGLEYNGETLAVTLGFILKNLL